MNNLMSIIMSIIITLASFALIYLCVDRMAGCAERGGGANANHFLQHGEMPAQSN